MLAKRKLGQQGLEVSALGLGCMGMSQSYGVPDDQEPIATIHRAIDLGVMLFDTAEVYAPYTNEELLGRSLKGRREQVIIATKFGFRIGDEKSGEWIAGRNTFVRWQRRRYAGSGPTISTCSTNTVLIP